MEENTQAVATMAPTVEAPVEQGEPVPKEPAVEEVKAPNKRELEKALKLLSVERGKHEKAVKECSGQRRKLKKSFNDTKLDRKKKVDEILENNFLDQSEKGLIDKVLTTAIKEPKLNQLQDSISKLEAQEEWHRSRLRDISKQETGFKGQIRKLEAGEALKACHKAKDDWHSSVEANEKAWFAFKEAVKKCHSYRLDYNLALKEHGIDDPIFFYIMQDKLRPGVLTDKLQASLLGELSKMALIRPNPFYVEPGRGSERLIGKRAKVDPRRESWS